MKIGRAVSILAAVASLAVFAIAVYLARSGVPLEDVAELVGGGGEQRLREPMRPPRSGARVLVIALDGVGDDELRLAIRVGSPNLARLVGPEGPERGVYAHAYAAPGVLSVLPSTTVAAWASVFTGEPPARTGVPGNEWFDREKGRYFAPGPVSVTESAHAVQVYSDGLVGSALRVPTLYELADVRSYVVLSQVHRGADLLTMPDLEALGRLATAVAEGLTGGGGVSQEAYAELDRSAVESLLESVREYGLADLQVVYFPGVDLYTHVADDPIASQRRYLREVVDPAVGEILEMYRRLGSLEETYVLFLSDHGHTPVLSDDRHALGTEGDDEPPALIAGAGFRMRPFVLDLPEDRLDFQATVAYQGALAYVYLADRSTCPTKGDRCDWSRPPRLEEDVLPIVRAFDAANRTGTGVPALQGSLDLIFARTHPAPGEDALPFQVWNGERLVPIPEYLAVTPRPDLLELEARLRGLAAGPYGHLAGDVLLLARSGAERPIEDRFYFSGEYRSWHGSPSEQDSTIPLLLARAASSGTELRDRLQEAVGSEPRQTDVLRLILHLLEAEGRDRAGSSPAAGR